MVVVMLGEIGCETGTLSRPGGSLIRKEYTQVLGHGRFVVINVFRRVEEVQQAQLVMTSIGVDELFIETLIQPHRAITLAINVYVV